MDYCVWASPNILEDLALKEHLCSYFHDPISLLTFDVKLIRERNLIIKSLMEHESLYTSLCNLHEKSQQLLQMTRLKSNNEPAVILDFINDFPIFYIAIDDACTMIESIDVLPDYFRRLCAGLRSYLATNFPYDFLKLCPKFITESVKAESITFMIHFSKYAEIKSIAISKLSSQKYNINTYLSRWTDNKSLKALTVQTLAPRAYSEMYKSLNRNWQTLEPIVFSNSCDKLMNLQLISAKDQLTSVQNIMQKEILHFANELPFFIKAVQYANDLKRQADNVCFAKIENIEDKTLIVNKMQHPALIRMKSVVTNDASLAQGQEIALLGGTNRGGKTVYLQTIGAMQILFQMGLPLPAANARISPVKKIVNVFASAENASLKYGQLGHEITTICTAIDQVNEESLFLFNEPITATSSFENYFISKEAICVLMAKKARGVWVTHLYTLFGDIPKMNKLDIGSTIFSMRTGQKDDKQNSFKIITGAPDYYSGAKELYISVTENNKHS